MHRRRIWAGAVAAGVVAVLCACSASEPRPPVSSSTPAQQTPQATTPTDAAPTESEPPAPAPVRPLGEPVVIASGLDAPWSILRLPNGASLISERDTALVRELLPDGSLRDAGSVAGVVPNGEGGLLGLAYLPLTDNDSGWVYAYFTAASDNRIVRMPLTGAAGSVGLGEAETVLTGIPAAGNHNGGRLGFGPDGLLYATAGDAGNSGNAQDLG